jgi:hypothetical protein
MFMQGLVESKRDGNIYRTIMTLYRLDLCMLVHANFLLLAVTYTYLQSCEPFALLQRRLSACNIVSKEICICVCHNLTANSNLK